jgi:capsular polysaccharide biosynthesis protein
MLGIRSERIVSDLEEPTVFAAAWYLSPIFAQRAAELRGTFLTVRERMLEASIDSGSVDERVWIERAVGINNQRRDIVNREEIDELLKRYGFARLDFAALPLRRQVGAAKAIRVLAGPHGAGSVHALFMPRSSDVIECYSPLLIQPGVVEICSIMDHRYSMLVYNSGYEPYAWGDSLMINRSHLDLTLRQLG